MLKVIKNTSVPEGCRKSGNIGLTVGLWDFDLEHLATSVRRGQTLTILKAVFAFMTAQLFMLEPFADLLPQMPTPRSDASTSAGIRLGLQAKGIGSHFQLTTT